MTGLRTALLYDYGRRIDARNTDGYLAVTVYAKSVGPDGRWVGHRGADPVRYQLHGRREALGWLVVSLAELRYEEFRAVPKGEL